MGTHQHMNVHCLNCRTLRMLARVRAGSASPLFTCLNTGDIKTHLMPGTQPTRLNPKDGSLLSAEVLNPEVQHVPD